MMTEIQRENLTIEDARRHVPTLQFFHEKDECYLVAGDAAKLLSWLNGREIGVRYLSNAIRDGKLHPKHAGDRNMYPFTELRMLIIRPTVGRPSEVKLSKESKDAIAEGQRKRWQRKKESPENSEAL